ncbi:MAG: BamA/TamA family outer membrane protein, partial [Bacteroidales bacterium]|nr:BamA/TamA family outer membrane protein [Bacteroidales bacterium]
DKILGKYFSKIALASAAIIAGAVATSSCSTTRLLGDGEYRLAKNSIEITNDKSFDNKEISQYIKQQPKGFNPFLYLYNWSGKDESKAINRFIRKLGVAPVVYESDLVESSVSNIKNHLEYIGYYNSNVESSVTVKKKNVTVNYAVTLGKRFPIKEIVFNLPERGEFAADFMKDSANVTIHPGDYVSEALLESETVRSSAVMRQMGYYGFTKNYYFFEADTLSHPDSAVLSMTINEYTRNDSPNNAVPFRKYHIGNVSISRPATLEFRDKVLKGMNTIQPGEIYSESNINNTYSRISSLKAFNSVNVQLDAVDTNVVDCSINLTQSKLQAYKIALEASSNSTGLVGVSPQLTYSHKNIFHGGEWLNLSFMGNFQFMFNDPTRSNELGVSAGLSFPKFLGLPYSKFKGPSIPRTEVNISYNYQNRPEYTRNTISSSFGYSGNIKNKLYYQLFPLQVNIVHLNHMDSDFYDNLSNNPFLRYAYQDHFDEGAGLSLYYTTNTDVIPTTTYHFFRFSADLSGNLLSAFNPLMRTNDEGSRLIWGIPYSQYVRAEFSTGKTWRFGKNNGWGLATRFLAGAGYAYGNSSALPFEKQFYSGGANGLRGWQARSIGPGSSEMNDLFSIPSQTGDMKLEANLELRFNLFWKLAGALFVDAGNVWNINEGSKNNSEASLPLNKDFFNTIAADWGTGLRVDLTFILLRIDLGMKLHDPSRHGNEWLTPNQWLKKDGFALHFGVGYPF